MNLKTRNNNEIQRCNKERAFLNQNFKKYDNFNVTDKLK